jgi:hypothetical protein
LSKVRIPVHTVGEAATSRLPKNFALIAPIGYCQPIGVIDNEQGESRAVLTNDVSSPHLSLGVRFSCMGADSYGHEHHGYDNRNEHYGNYRYHHRYYGNYRYHW